MLCVKKTILIEKGTKSILQSMFVISKTIDTIDETGSGMGDPTPEFPLHFHIFLPHFFSFFS